MKRSTLHLLLVSFAIVAVICVGVGVYHALRPPSTNYDSTAPEAAVSVKPVSIAHKAERREPVYVPPRPRVGKSGVERAVALGVGLKIDEHSGSEMSREHVLGVIESIVGNSSFEDRPEKLVELGKVLGARDFRFAMQLALAIDDSLVRGTLVQGILYAQGAADPKSALLAAFDLEPKLAEGEAPTLESRRQEIAFRHALTAALSGWASTDPEAALAYVNEQLDDSYKSQSVNAVYASWAEVDPKAAIAAAATLVGRQQRDVAQSIYRNWGGSNPAAAMAHASENLENGRTKDETLDGILRQWASDDLSGAVTWVEQTTENREEAVGALRTVAYGLASRKPAQAAALLNAYPELITSRGLSSRLASEWSKQDPAATAAWTEALADPGARDDAIKTTAGNWASQDYDQAYTWAQGLPDARSRALALSNVALRQAQEGMDQPTSWIQNLPAGFERDRTVAGYGLGVLRQHQDYGAARQLQGQMGSESVDMQKVSAIIEASNIPETDKALIRNMQ